jgi:hypothetical protein
LRIVPEVERLKVSRLNVHAMSKPVRLRLSRLKGSDLQQSSVDHNGRKAVVVSRPGRWGNPWKVGVEDATRQSAVARYRAALLGGRLNYKVKEVRAELAGKNLACWCDLGMPCHADVLLEIANAVGNP